MEGSITVNGILASCYPSVDHNSGHIGMTPLQWIPWMVEQICGEDNGLKGYAAITEHMSILTPYLEQYKEN